MKTENLLKNTKGFTFLEAMVTVAIIGIVTTITVPGFNKYRRASKQAEAKASLSTVYMSLKSFKLNYGGYTHDLLAAGVRPEGRLIYNIGFASSVGTVACTLPTTITSRIVNNRQNYFQLCSDDFTTAPDSTTLIPLQSCAFEYQGTTTINFEPPKIPTAFPTSDKLQPLNSSGNAPTTGEYCVQFKALAIGEIKKRKPLASEINLTADKDIWSIDHNRIVQHEQDGT